MLGGDSAFANAEVEKSQCGVCLGVTHDVDAAVGSSDFRNVIPLMYKSATVKRVVRSTLAAEAYAVSVAIETAQLMRHVLLELTHNSRGGSRPTLPGAVSARQDPAES